VKGKYGEDLWYFQCLCIALGHTRAGGYLSVIYIPDPEQKSIFVITAFELTGKPLHQILQHLKTMADNSR